MCSPEDKKGIPEDKKEIPKHVTQVLVFCSDCKVREWYKGLMAVLLSPHSRTPFPLHPNPAATSIRQSQPAEINSSPSWEVLFKNSLSSINHDF